MKIPSPIWRRIQKINTELEAIRDRVGELEMQKLTLANRYAELEQHKFHYWKDICTEMKLDPSGNYKIEDDGEAVSQERA